MVALRIACWIVLAHLGHALYRCASDIGLGVVRRSNQKGLAVDDVTLQWCSGKLPELWPNTQERVSTLRLFKAWDPQWDESRCISSWQQIVNFTVANDARVLVSTQVTCNETEDARAWSWTKRLLKMLGPKNIMGLAIGNELELLFTKAASIPPWCVSKVWEGQYFWKSFVRFVDEIDAMGFQEIPVTSAFGGLALAGNPFFEAPGKALVNTFLRQAHQKYGRRFVFMWNIYPYFDQRMHLDAGTSDRCVYSLGNATCMYPDCNVPKMAMLYRQKMQQLTGKPDDIMWIGETGWSAPKTGSLTTDMKNCPAWSTQQALQRFYQSFLYWDLNIGPYARPVDHVFYFTVRDSSTFGVGEHFGLIKSCEDQYCKIRSDILHI
jgi:hypothetical protein